MSDEEVYEKLLEAEEDMKNNQKLYSSEEIFNIINKIIKNSNRDKKMV